MNQNIPKAIREKSNVFNLLLISLSFLFNIMTSILVEILRTTMTYLISIALGLLLFALIFYGKQIREGNSNSVKYIKLVSIIGAIALLTVLYPSLNEKLKKFKTKINH